MKKYKILFAAAMIPALVSAQSAIDAYNLSQSDVRGTARFMSMGGAFTALGGDLSCLTQNPAGIGIYRRSEIGVTLDISPRRITSATATNSISSDKTKVYCNNFGYIGTAKLDGLMRTFSWGVSYNRIASFDHVFDAYNGRTATSLTNYIAAYTHDGEDVLGFNGNYNPYYDSSSDWLSILAYNSYMINPNGRGGYQGLYQNGTTEGDALSRIRESGYVDEYNIDFGGNVDDVVYWGLGFGITDLSYSLASEYSESMANAQIQTTRSGITTGDAGYNLYNDRRITGSGWNMKVGLIFKPINELRLGLAVHTPTWYSLNQSAYAETLYSYRDPNSPESTIRDEENPLAGSEYTEESYYRFKLNAPWKIMAGAAAVIGNRAIVSLDYEHQAFNNMSTKYEDQFGSFTTDEYVKSDIEQYFKGTDIIRIGAEYRVAPNFSIRAGYNHATTNVKEEADNGSIEVLTAGMNPSYTFNKSTNAISCGLGYKYKSFYLDAAYIWKQKKSTYHAFTDFNGNAAPTADLTETTNSIVLSAGFKF